MQALSGLADLKPEAPEWLRAQAVTPRLRLGDQIIVELARLTGRGSV